MQQRLYQYVKSLVSRSEEKVENWRNICQWLEEAGYKNRKKNQSKTDHATPIDARVNIENITFDRKNKIEIGVLIQLVLPLPSDTSKKTPAHNSNEVYNPTQ